MATQMELEVFGKKLRGHPDFYREKQQQSRIFFRLIFNMYTDDKVAYLPSQDFELDFRVRMFLGGGSNKFSVVLDNVLCQRCYTSFWGFLKM